MTVTKDLAYGSGADHNLDLYQLTGDGVAKRPVIVWIHGGEFTTGDKSSGASRATFLAKLGYVVASINYRLLSPDGCGGSSGARPGTSTPAAGRTKVSSPKMSVPGSWSSLMSPALVGCSWSTDSWAGMWGVGSFTVDLLSIN